MSSHNEAIREIFITALATMSPSELMGLTMEPYRELAPALAEAA